MIKNYFKIAWRNLIKSKGYSAINIGGLAVGMAVAMLIGFWIYDEISFNKSFKNYEQLGQLYQNRTFDGKIGTYNIVPIPMGKELRTNYPDFEDVAMTSRANEHIIAFNDVKITRKVMYVEPAFTRMFSLKMLQGAQNSLEGVNEIVLSGTMAHALFGNADPMGKIVKLDNKTSLSVTGVFEDFSKSSEFSDIDLLVPWAAYLAVDEMAKANVNNWGINDWICYVQLNKNIALSQVQAKVKPIFYQKISNEGKASKPELLIHPMNKWHLYDNFTNGINEGGRIQIVWLFGFIGVFVLLLACINFMNLSTARSEKRAKEVGVRKVIGSVRSQLIYQFLSESLLVVFLASLVSVLLVIVSMPWFNNLTGKQMEIPWANEAFWIISIGFIFTTGLLSGSYPALYLSSFNPVRVLKGPFKDGRFTSLPRKMLVVLQFTVSVMLIIGTIVVYQQIQYIKNRPIGYDNNRLIFIKKNTPELNKLNYEVLRNELLTTNVVENMSESENAITTGGALNTGFAWEGINPKSNLLFSVQRITHDEAATLGFQFSEGRDFSRNFSTDSSAIILNETAAAIIGRKGILNKIIMNENKKYQVIGIVKDMVGESPYSPILPGIYLLDYNNRNIINIKLKATVSTGTALAKIAAVFKKLNPAAPFDYKFADKELSVKFASDELIGKLATCFGILAIFISCLGLFGLASFVAEQRSKEIGIRKVLGASVTTLCQLLSKEFLVLVIISCVIAIPVSYYFMADWLQKYEFRTNISWWIFAAAGLGALMITLLTVSFQAIKAAIANPVKSLRTE